MELLSLLKKAVAAGGSDIFVIPGAPAMIKVRGQLEKLTEDRFLPGDTVALINSIYFMAGRSMDMLNTEGDDDFSFAVMDLSRFRCNVYKQRGTMAVTCRIVRFGLPDPSFLHIPRQVMDLSRLLSGMVLVTGPAGSGKSTTLACIVDRINSTRAGHIVTVEDPIEYLHGHKMSIVSQREVPGDAPTFDRALHAVLRQAPDVIMLGEMRDIETIRTAITAAETGHLLLSSLHTIGAGKTVDRILDVFPAEQQPQIRVQLSMVLRAVVSQRLIALKDGTLYPVFEVMTVNAAIQNMIREGRTHQIDNAIFGGGADMLSMDQELIRMVRERKIDRDTAIAYAINAETMAKRV